MKRMIKEALGRCAIPLAVRMPGAKRLLRPIGIRTSQGLFGDRIVSIQIAEGQPFRLTHVDESYLAFQLFWRGGDYYEPITRALLQSLVRPADTFLDIGAHVGFFSLAIGLSVSETRIIAFEPNPKNFRILRANAAANDLSDIFCEPIAISDHDGQGTLYLTESDMSASLMKDFHPEDTKQIDSIHVRTASLDSYLKGRGIKGPLVIKVDIEGHEPAFFRGAAETIATYKPDIILEVLYEQEPGLVAHLKSLGYHFYRITDQGLVELEAPRLVKRLPFLFLNALLSVRPKQEIATLFNRVGEAIGRVNLLETTKYISEGEWPCWWSTETAPESVARSAFSSDSPVRNASARSARAQVSWNRLCPTFVLSRAGQERTAWNKDANPPLPPLLDHVIIITIFPSAFAVREQVLVARAGG